MNTKLQKRDSLLNLLSGPPLAMTITGSVRIYKLSTISIPLHSPFPEVAESVQQELESYRNQEDEVKRLKTIMVRSSQSL